MKALKISSFIIFLLSSFAEATPNSLTYQGRIVRSDGIPLESSGVKFLFDITSDNGACVIYREESQAIDMTNSNGVFDVPLGAGSFSVQFPLTGTFTLKDAFNNKTSSFACEAGGTWTPSVDSMRKLRVRFWDGSGWRLVSEDMQIRSVPFAHYAESAAKADAIGALTAADLLQKSQLPNSSGTPVACTAGQVLSFNGAQFVCVTDQVGTSGGGITSLAGDTTSAHVFATGSAGNSPAWNHNGTGTHTLNIPLASTSSVTAGLISNTDYAAFSAKQNALPSGNANQVLRWDGSTWTGGFVNAFELKNSLGNTQFPTSCPVNTTLNWSAITDAFTCNTISLNANQITAGTIDSARLPASSTAWQINGNDISYSGGKVGINTLTPTSMFEVNGIARAIQFEAHFTSPGFILKDTDSVGNAASGDIRGISSDNTIRWSVGDYSGDLRVTNRNLGGSLILKTENKDRVTVLANGSVGVGTSTPGSPLEVHSSTDGGGLFYLQANGVTTPTNKAALGFYAYTSDYSNAYLQNTAMLYLGNTTQNLQIASPHASGVIRFNIGGFSSATSERMRIDSTGKVGIGTASPTATLDVNGKIRGVASIGYGRIDAPGISTTSTTSTFISTLSASVDVQDGDVVKAELSCSMNNSGGVTYIRPEVFATPGGTWLLPSNWASASMTTWTSGSSFGLYKASANGTLTFRGYWHVGSGTGGIVYCNILAQVIGK
ncbi:hypothetical protein [Bdellovibrio bacteriovorus]|uniref:hypothetical protein n=1 Tax=Bdellovibrio bacteriovorus TaxID=959 RepID=UPI0035A6DE64